jgi:ribosome-associated protein
MLTQTQILEQIQHVLEEMKAQDIITLDISKKTSLADYMVICTGRASRHVTAIAEELFMQLKKSGLDYLRISGTEHGEWALIDCGDIIVHVMQAEIRAYYNLEELWKDHPISQDHA